MYRLSWIMCESLMLGLSTTRHIIQAAATEAQIAATQVMISAEMVVPNTFPTRNVFDSRVSLPL